MHWSVYLRNTYPNPFGSTFFFLYYYYYSQCRYTKPWTQNNETALILNAKIVTKSLSKERHQILSMTLKTLKKLRVCKSFVEKSSFLVNPMHIKMCSGEAWCSLHIVPIGKISSPLLDMSILVCPVCSICISKHLEFE